DPSPGSELQHHPTAAQRQPAPPPQPAPQAQPARQHDPEQQAQQPARPDGIDPETYRQFQQFQQFQEFQRFQQLQQYGGNQPAPQHTTGRRLRAPRWLRWLARKLLAWLIFVLLTIIALYAAFNYFFGDDDTNQQPAAESGGGTYHTNDILPDKPYEAVRTLYEMIATGTQGEAE